MLDFVRGFAMLVAMMIVSNLQAIQPSRPCGTTVTGSHHQPQGTAGLESSMTFEERFWSKVDRRGPDECWLWTARIHGGYGVFAVRGDKFRMRSAHRVAWELSNGPIPPGMCICHHCDNPPCCNPHHLFAGTHADNMADMRRKGRDNHPGGTRNAGSVNGQAKLTDADVRAMRRAHVVTKIPTITLAKQFGVSHVAAWYVVHRVTWKHIK
jgi:hypothetical protein